MSSEAGRKQEPQPRSGISWLALVPLAVFVGLGGVFAVRLFSGRPDVLPSTLINKPVPVFSLPPVEGLAGDPGLSDRDLKTGKVTVVNFFASWCPPCREEHPQLLELAKDERITLYGVDLRDPPEDARRFIARAGNPFAAIGADRSGRVSIDWGIYGAPETFIVKGDGTILFKQIGVITPEVLQKVIRPKIEAALGG